MPVAADPGSQFPDGAVLCPRNPRLDPPYSGATGAASAANRPRSSVRDATRPLLLVKRIGDRADGYLSALKRPLPNTPRRMKILVADDDRIARKVLRALLEEAGFEVETVEDGRHALAALVSPHPPHVAILDWMMPVLSGPEVCAKLRTARLKIRPYVLMLSSKTDKNDIVAGLDAGADDYLSKPFNLGELLARLRVANRVIEYEVEVQKHVEELEELTRRHQLLGELITQPSASVCVATEVLEDASEVPAAPDSAAAPQSIEAATAAPPVTLATAEITRLVIRALAELGLQAALWPGEAGATPYRRVTYSAWAGCLLHPSHLWMDLLLEAEPAAVNALFERALHRPPSISDGQSFMAEALTIISTAFQTALQGLGVETLEPYLPQVQRVDRSFQSLPTASNTAVITYDISGSLFTLSVAHQLRPLLNKETGKLRSLDVLTDVYPPLGVAEVALLNRGTVLNERYIEKLRAFGEATAEAHPVPVIEPTTLAAFFNHGLKR